jgi:iron complex outermembrane receptor protein
MIIKFVGFEDQYVTLKVPTSKPIVVKMKPSAKILHDIVIEGQHSRNHSLTQSLSILSEEQMLSSRGKALGEMIQQIPGVQSIMTGASIFKPVIHGLYGQRILILNSGLRQEGQQWGLEHAPEIDSYIASEIEVVKGSEAVRYGADAMGGAIIINTAPLHLPSGLGGELNAGLSSNNRGGSFSGMLEGGLAKHLGWRVQGTIKKGGDYHSPGYNLSNTSAREMDMSAALGFEKNGSTVEIYGSTFNTEIGILRSAHVGNLNDLQQSIVAELPRYVSDFTYDISNPRQKIGHHLIRVSADFPVAETNHLRLIYGSQYNQRREFDVRRGDQSIPSLSFELFAHSLDLSLDHGKGNWSGSIGASGILKDNYNERATGLLPDYSQLNLGIFLVEKWRKNKWLVEGGFRVDRQNFQVWMFDQSELINPKFNLQYVSASAGATVHPGNNTKVSTNVALAARPPHISELFGNGLHHSAASIEKGLLIGEDGVSTDQSAIRKERSFQWVNSFQFNRQGTSLEFSLYANYFNDYVYVAPAGTRLTVRGFFPVFEYRQTNALLTGADFFLSQDLSKHLGLTSKFSYVMADDRKSEGRLPFIPPAQWENGMSYKRSSIGKWKNFFVTLTGQAVFEQTRAPRTILPRDVTEEALTENFDFMPAPDPYVLVKLETGSTLTLENRDLTVSFAVENLLDRSYRNYMNRLRYYADEAGRNISIRLNYKFHAHD